MLYFFCLSEQSQAIPRQPNRSWKKENQGHELTSLIVKPENSFTKKNKSSSIYKNKL